MASDGLRRPKGVPRRSRRSWTILGPSEGIFLLSSPPVVFRDWSSCNWMRLSRRRMVDNCMYAHPWSIA